MLHVYCRPKDVDRLKFFMYEEIHGDEAAERIAQLPPERFSERIKQIRKMAYLGKPDAITEEVFYGKRNTKTLHGTEELAMPYIRMSGARPEFWERLQTYITLYPTCVVSALYYSKHGGGTRMTSTSDGEVYEWPCGQSGILLLTIPETDYFRPYATSRSIGPHIMLSTAGAVHEFIVWDQRARRMIRAAVIRDSRLGS